MEYSTDSERFKIEIIRSKQVCDQGDRKNDEKTAQTVGRTVFHQCNITSALPILIPEYFCVFKSNAFSPVREGRIILISK